MRCEVDIFHSVVGLVLRLMGRRRARPIRPVMGDDLRSGRVIGIDLAKQRSPAVGIAATARNLPVTLSDVQQVWLFFGYDDHLWRVYAASTQWESDKYGTRAMARFQELSSLLSAKYGTGKSFNREPANEFMRAPDEFASTISSKDRIVAMTWDDGAVSIELTLGAQIYDTYYTLSYENNALAAAARKAIREHEKGAL